MTKKKPEIDWPAIEKDFRTGTGSIREIARWYQISDTLIHRKAKAEGWVREGIVPPVPKDPVERPEYEVSIARAKAVPKIDDVIGRGRNLADRMLDELDAETSHLGEMEHIINLSEEDPQRVAALQQAVSLPTRAKTLQTIALALKTMGETATKGKKADKQSAAEDAAQGGGKFAPRPGPSLVVNNR